MIKFNLNNMDIFKFVIYVLVFVLIFTLIFTMQMKSLMKYQNKILEQYFEKPKTTTTSTYNPNTYTKTTQDEIKKYNPY